MQSVLLSIDESININEFINKIQTIYGCEQVKPVINNSDSAKIFGEMPDMFFKSNCCRWVSYVQPVTLLKSNAYSLRKKKNKAQM